MQATIKNCYNKARYVTATTSVQYNELLLSPLAVSNDIDFEDYVTMTDEFATCVQPDSEAIFNEILSVTQHSKRNKVQEMDRQKDDDPSDDETEKQPTVKKDDVKRVLEQFKDFTAKKKKKKKTQACLLDL